MARGSQMTDPIDLDAARKKKAKRIVPGSAEALMGLLLTDMGNAERFVRHFAGKVRYCHGRKKWLIWDKVRWSWDTNGRIERMAKIVVRNLYREAAANKDDANARYQIAQHAKASEKTSAIAAMLRAAQVEDGIPVALEDLDANPMLLNCRNGTIDLETGTLRPHDQADLITKVCPCDFEPGATHPVFDEFLFTATNGDLELISYIRRAAGYSIQGSPDEKVLFFVYGPPNSAKSTLIDALAAALGDYHISAAASTWLQQTQQGGNRGDIVRLAGARLVTTVEFNKGAKFDEEIIKRVTGGDIMTAMAKYEAEVEFRPQFALWLAANDAPSIRAGDGGMWSRMRRIPFAHVIEPGKRDKGVKRTLQHNLDCRAAVLAWAVRGCLEWQKQGLGSADAVDASTAAYQVEMDPIADFLDDRLIFDGGTRIGNTITPKDLRRAYDSWAKEEGIRVPLSRKEFQDAITKRGAKYGKTHAGNRIVYGVRERGEFEDREG